MKKLVVVILSVTLSAVSFASSQIVDNRAGEFVRGGSSIPGTSSGKANVLCTDGDFLYAGIGDEIHCIDISSPKEPKLLSKVRIYGLVRQIAVSDGTLFAACRESGVWLVDVRKPGKINIITRYDPVELATGIEVCGNVLYLGTRQNGVECVDISDIHNPTHIRMEKTSESQSVTYRNGILYSGEWGGHCISVIDTRDMSAFRILRTVNLQGYGDGVWTYGNFLYASTGHHLTDSSLSEAERYGHGHGLEIFDISVPDRPVFLSRIGFDSLYVRRNDYWTPRPCSDGKFVICADSFNGLYVVDSSDPRNPRIVSRVYYTDDKGKNIPVNSIAVAKSVVYVAVDKEFGIVCLDCPGVFPNVKEKGEAPSKASYRYPYLTPKESRFVAWKPRRGAPVRGVAAKGNIMYAACSYGGLAVLRMKENGRVEELAYGPMPFAEDVKVRGDRLYVAEGRDGLAVYETGEGAGLRELARFRDFRKDGPMAYCLWVYVPCDGYVAASTRLGGNYYLDISGFPEIKYAGKFGGAPGWDKYSADRCDSAGWYPTVRHRSGIFWINLKDAPLKEVKDEGIIPSLKDGVCRFGEDRFITCSDGGLYIYSSSRMREKKKPVAVGDFEGSPVWDGGKRISLTCRIEKQIRLVDISDEKNPRLLWKENTEGYPEIPIFWQGRLAVPCGYQGLLIEK